MIHTISYTGDRGSWLVFKNKLRYLKAFAEMHFSRDCIELILNKSQLDSHVIIQGYINDYLLPRKNKIIVNKNTDAVVINYEGMREFSVGINGNGFKILDSGFISVTPTPYIKEGEAVSSLLGFRDVLMQTYPALQSDIDYEKESQTYSLTIKVNELDKSSKIELLAMITNRLGFSHQSIEDFSSIEIFYHPW
ncbi:MAG: hypothetical protein MJZ83_04730 [Bacteroidaceae bacterium]|nr:hypothetical protein [Bacteroidaceae bacterium]